ncbi:MAG: zinc ribbon-containing protein [Bacillota bacterium]
MFSSGDSVKKGTYKCITCDEKIIIKKNGEVLPECPKYKAFLWKKVI